MFRFLLVATVLAFAIPAALPASAATTPCKPTATKKCPTPKTAAKKTKPKKPAKATKGRSDYTAEQRKQMMERAREICRKEVGASSTVYRIDYAKNRVICWRPGA